jgi:hypothetical protein
VRWPVGLPSSTRNPQAISFCAALLGKTGGREDGLPRMAAAPPPAAAAAAGGAPRGGAHAAREDSEGQRWPILVVCPTAVVANWQQEFAMWGSFQVGAPEGR